MFKIPTQNPITYIKINEWHNKLKFKILLVVRRDLEGTIHPSSLSKRTIRPAKKPQSPKTKPAHNIDIKPPKSAH